MVIVMRPQYPIGSPYPLLISIYIRSLCSFYTKEVGTAVFDYLI